MVYDEFLREEEVLTCEMIMPQTDTKFLTELRVLISDLANTVNSKDYRNTSVLIEENPGVHEKIIKISEVLSKRFNFNISLTLEPSMSACTTVTVPGSLSILSNSDWMVSLKEYFDKKKGMIYKDIKTMSDFKRNVDDYYNQLYKNVKAFDKILDNFNISIDLKNATISGLPKDYWLLMRADFCYLLNRKGNNLSPDELIAILLHEIGHNFTTFEKLYFNIRNSAVILDAIRDTANNGVKDIPSILKIVSKKMGNNPNKNSMELLVDLRRTTIGSLPGEVVQYNNEQQADQFVTRFGLGAPLATGLTKYGAWVRITNATLVDKIETAVSTGIVLSLLVIPTIMVPAAFVAATVLLATTVGMYISNQLTNLTNNIQAKQSDVAYEMDYTRTLRIKQDLIRQVRILDKVKDKLLIKQILESVEIIDEKLVFIENLIEKVKNNSWIERYIMARQFSDKQKSLIEMNDLVQELMENELHLKLLKL